MIVTLTANPSLDRTLGLAAALRPGAVQAATDSREDAGGKGINVARALAAAGAEVVAVLPLAADDPFDAALQATGIQARRVPVRGHVRANLAITDPAGVTTKLNLPGLTLSGSEAAAVIETVVDACAGALWLVLAGSLPLGVADDFYVDVIEAVRAAHGTDAPRFAVDTSGAALAAVVARGEADLIKPNDEELAELARTKLPTGDLAHGVAAVASTIVPSRVRTALVTLGSRGAVLVSADGSWAVSSPVIEAVSTVGAGDSSLAGYLLADVTGSGPEGRLRNAVRYGAAAASLPGTQAPSPADLPTADVFVTPLSSTP
ncbi:1-phosphofructokinase [Microbacterium sp. Root166]|uniref:1-phosphofructokinase family hexose kinase n=1 Tax=Microbacterium sp. Root166 TaxID=1736478 RepID=UPI0006F74DF6|nr:hexose kinase [Microbacterium sp. Root166]KQZ84679.1 1-phosphofructokinase [Microbacterium sp. Root166]